LSARNLKIDNIEEDLSSGVMLANLLEILTGKTIKINSNPKNKAFKIDNVNKCLNFINEQLHIKLIATGAQGKQCIICSNWRQDIVDGHSVQIMGMIWAMIRKSSFNAAGSKIHNDLLTDV
jgi:hypothetical protein